jgi:acyl-CoA thioesterase
MHDTTNQTSFFERDTTLDLLGDGIFAARVPAHWWIERGPNGGFLAALFVRALSETLAMPQRPIRSLTVHYLRPPAIGDCRIRCSVERSGRTLTTLSARMEQQDKTVALALAAFATSRSGVEFDQAQMPGVAGPDQLPRWEVTDGGELFYSLFDYRWVFDETPQTDHRPGRTGGWIRLSDPATLDAALAAVFLDAWLPSLFSHTQRPGGAPTVDMTIHFRDSLPYAGAHLDDYCFTELSSTLSREGFFEEDGRLWSPSGQLLAHSRQLALAFEPADA